MNTEQKPQILVVDDFIDNLYLLENLLGKLQVNLILAESGMEALEKIEDQEIMLAILDIQMPGMNGIQLARTIWNDKSRERLPVIFITGLSNDEELLEECYTSGAVDFLLKPLNRKILFSKVEVFLDLYAQKQQVLKQNNELIRQSMDLSIANQLLMESHGFSNSLLQAIPYGMDITDDTGEILFISENFKKLFDDDPTGKKCYEVYHNDDKRCAGCPFPPGINVGETSVHEVSGLLNDKIFEVSNTGMLFHGQKVMLKIFHDVTEEKRMKNLLTKTIEQLTLAQESSGAGVWDWEIRTGRLSWSSALYKLFDLDARVVLPEFKTWREILHPDDRILAEERINEAIREHTGLNSEYRIILPSGEFRWINALGNTTYDNFGEALRMTGICIDITDKKNKEEVIKESERNFHTFFETIGDMIVVATLDGRILMTNRALKQKLGYSDAQLSGFSVPDLHPPELRETAVEIFKAMLAGERTDCQLPLFVANGEQIPVETHIWRGRWDGIDCIFSISRDLTLVNEAFQRFEHLFRNNPALMAISKPSDLSFVDINNAFLTTLGYSPDEIIGKTPDDLKLFAHPEQLAAVAIQLMTEGSINSIELQVVNKDGHYVDGLFSGEIITINGQKFLLTVMLNISKRKQAEEALRQSEQMYRTLLNASPEGIIIMDITEKITEVSNITLEIFGAENKLEFLGEHFFRFIPKDEINKWQDVLKRTQLEGLVQNVEFILAKKNKSQFICELSTTLIQDVDGSPKAFMAIIRDISQRKKIEQQLIRTERMVSLGEMASAMAHEINQPLLSISLGIENFFHKIQQSKEVDESYLKNKTEKIMEDILRISYIIDHVRAFSRDHDDYIGSSFNINDSIHNAISMISEQFKNRGIELMIRLSKNIKAINGNTFKFEQVILNLLNNAKDALDEKAKSQKQDFSKSIRITSFFQDQSNFVEIRDNGIGIKADEINRIMLPFYTTKEVGHGTGLGLSISFGIIKEMNGSIEVESEPSSGTIFRIKLPVIN